MESGGSVRQRARRRVVVAAAASLVALVLAACDSTDPGEPGQTTAATETSSPDRSREPVELTATEEFDPRYGCFVDLPDARWLAGESEGVEVGAALVGSGDRLVVLGHQSNGDPCSWIFFARRLVTEGYLVAVPAYRGGDPIALQLAVVAHALADGATDVVLGGASMGGTYAIGAAVEMDPAPVGVFALSSPGEFDPPGPPAPVDATAAAAELTMPLLVMVGQHDTAFVSSAEQLATAAGTEAIVIQTGGHGIDLLGVDGVIPQVLDFIAAPG